MNLMWMVIQMVYLLILLLSFSFGGFTSVFGVEAFSNLKMVIEFGVCLFGLSGLVMARFFPTERHRIYRGSQINIFSYITVLFLFQMVALFLTGTFSSFGEGVAAKLPPTLMNILTVSFSFVAITMPITVVKNWFHIANSIELRDPKKIIRDLYS